MPFQTTFPNKNRVIIGLVFFFLLNQILQAGLLRWVWLEKQWAGFLSLCSGIPCQYVPFADDNKTEYGYVIEPLNPHPKIRGYHMVTRCTGLGYIFLVIPVLVGRCHPVVALCIAVTLSQFMNALRLYIFTQLRLWDYPFWLAHDAVGVATAILVIMIALWVTTHPTKQRVVSKQESAAHHSSS